MSRGLPRAEQVSNPTSALTGQEASGFWVVVNHEICNTDTGRKGRALSGWSGPALLSCAEVQGEAWKDQDQEGRRLRPPKVHSPGAIPATISQAGSVPGPCFGNPVCIGLCQGAGVTPVCLPHLSPTLGSLERNPSPIHMVQGRTRGPGVASPS